MADAIDQFLGGEGQGKEYVRCHFFHFTILIEDEQDGQADSFFAQRLADPFSAGPQGGSIDHDQIRSKTICEARQGFTATGGQFNNETFFPQGRSEGGMICVLALYEQKCSVIHVQCISRIGNDF